MCPRCSYPFYVVTNYKKWVITSWTYSKLSFPCENKISNGLHFLWHTLLRLYKTMVVGYQFVYLLLIPNVKHFSTLFRSLVDWMHKQCGNIHISAIWDFAIQIGEQQCRRSERIIFRPHDVVVYHVTIVTIR